MSKITKAKALEILINHRRNGRGAIFYAEFTKQDGTYRKMMCRFGVKKDIKGGVSSSAGDTVTVYDTDKKGYRSIPISRLSHLTINHKYYEVK